MQRNHGRTSNGLHTVDRVHASPDTRACSLWHTFYRHCVPCPWILRGASATGSQRTNTNRLRIEADDIPQHFTDGDNVGLLLGEPSGWLVDVDLDCEEAIELAEHYLPPTNAITGRDGSPRSHWWYFATDCKTARFRDAKLTNGAATTVELRSTGLQTLVGPSRHPTGAIYELLQGEPATVSADELRAPQPDCLIRTSRGDPRAIWAETHAVDTFHMSHERGSLYRGCRLIFL